MISKYSYSNDDHTNLLFKKRFRQIFTETTAALKRLFTDKTEEKQRLAAETGYAKKCIVYFV